MCENCAFSARLPDRCRAGLFHHRWWSALMRWALSMLMVAAGLGLALIAQPLTPRPVASGGFEPGVLAWASVDGRRPVASAALGARGCTAMVLPAGAKAPVPQGSAGWAGARRWIGLVQGWPESPAVQAWRHFVMVTKRGEAPRLAAVQGPCPPTLAVESSLPPNG
jgi:hypothetical protein